LGNCSPPLQSAFPQKNGPERPRAGPRLCESRLHRCRIGFAGIHEGAASFPPTRADITLRVPARPRTTDECPPQAYLQPPRPVAPGTRIGHVHLKVADLERALGFYCGVLGFELMQRYGTDAAFISAGGYHHHIGLNTWESRGGSPPPPGATGLFHTAILYPTRAALADALRRLSQAGIPLDGASDHGVSEALYLRDPDQNGVELYRDRPADEWPRDADGRLAMHTRRLDLQDLLSAAEV
jgi:catechol 2,3-dioxygenase